MNSLIIAITFYSNTSCKEIPKVVDVKLVQTTQMQIDTKDSPSMTHTYCKLFTESGQTQRKGKGGTAVYD